MVLPLPVPRDEDLGLSLIVGGLVVLVASVTCAMIFGESLRVPAAMRRGSASPLQCGWVPALACDDVPDHDCAWVRRWRCGDRPAWPVVVRP